MGNANATKKPVFQDWHPADVVAEIRKSGTSLRRLSLKHGYAGQSLQIVLRRPWPRAERIVAAAIGRRPQAIWPSRYHADGTPKRGRPSGKHTSASARASA